jgi:nucleoside-diphosphate-sugar epimerase
MVSILITGANSFIGTNFRNYSDNHKIKEISLRKTKPEDIDFREVDIVLHLAAIVHQSKKIEEQEYFRINRDLCLRVAELAKKSGVKQFIFLSSVKVYGKFVPGSDPWNEGSACFPDSAYGKSKYEAELALNELNDAAFIVSIIRTPLVYGNGVKANMLKLIRLTLSCKILPLGKIENKRNYSYIENLTGFIDRVIEKKISGVFIAMDDKSISTTELVYLLSGFLNKKLKLFRLPSIFRKAGFVFLPRFFEPLFGSSIMDNSKTKKMLDYNPPYTTADGLQKMINSFIK